MKRDMNFAGSFYSREKDEILHMFSKFNNIIDENIKDSQIYKKENTLGAIVPHAGYIYSGLNANLAYRALEDLPIEKIAVIGPSHHFYFEDISIGDFDCFITPLGDLQCDKELVSDLKNNFDIKMNKNAHMEHSTEVQFPFIKHYFSNAKVIEIVYGKFQGEKLEEIIEYLIEENVTLVISTDLSHFHSLEEANKRDNICLEAIENKDVKKLDLGCEACGKRGVKATLEVANKRELNTKVLYYNTSADASKDESRVVGYLSGLLYR
ncbi:MAG: AmmeMemoRadiSam system protein B [Campylobacterales bacterium]|nr:AmmeMemoRadiSam system protein B [Campylobacterales bacterium]